MNTKHKSAVSEQDQALIRDMAANHKYVSEAFTANPENKEKLKHLNYSAIIYWFRKFQAKPSAESVSVVAQVSNGQTLNFCPCCGVGLQNIQNTLILQANGKI